MGSAVPAASSSAACIAISGCVSAITAASAGCVSAVTAASAGAASAAIAGNGAPASIAAAIPSARTFFSLFFIILSNSPFQEQSGQVRFKLPESLNL